MKLFSFLLPAYHAGIIQPGSLSATCFLNGDVEVDLTYEPANMNLDYVFADESASTIVTYGTLPYRIRIDLAGPDKIAKSIGKVFAADRIEISPVLYGIFGYRM